jgi:hypothetical protein
MDVVAELKKVVKKLSESDQTIAGSLIASVERRGTASEKQFYWLDLLLKRANGEVQAPKAEKIGSLKKIHALFDSARGHLKYPAIILGWAETTVVDGEKYYNIHRIKLTVAGEKAKQPGTINVINADFNDWYGRITRDGIFQHGHKHEAPQEVSDLLVAFAKDPVKVAKDQPRFLQGKCCFCNRRLEDERSTQVGYGPVCAEHWDLPWGK